MEFNQRKSVFEDFRRFDYSADEYDFIEVTSWTNGEGWDIHIMNRGNEKTISLSFQELDAIKLLTAMLDYPEKDKSDDEQF